MHRPIHTYRTDRSVALEQLPLSLRTLADFEQLLLYKPDAFYGTSGHNTSDTQYLPTNPCVFELPCYWIRRKHLSVYKCHHDCVTSLNWPIGTRFDDEALFPIHPLSIPYYSRLLSATGARNAREDGVRILALPTSSVRTVLAWRDQQPETALYLKLTLMYSPIGDRRIWTAKGAGCVGRTKLLEESRDPTHSSLVFLSEAIALTPRRMPDGGAIVRAIPREVKSGRTQPVPLFALLGGDKSTRPLLLTVAERTRMSPLEFVEQTLCANFAAMWATNAMTRGLLPEYHGQNLLLALSSDLTSLGYFYYRDLEGLAIDWPLRRARRLPMPSLMPYAWSWDDAYESLSVGARRWDPLWWKLKVSWYAYAKFVLSELNQCMIQWRHDGRVGGKVLSPEHLTTVFSHHVFREAERISGEHYGARYNVYERPGQFHKDILKHRAGVCRYQSGH